MSANHVFFESVKTIRMIRLFSDLNSNSQDLSQKLHSSGIHFKVRRDSSRHDLRKVRWSWCPLLSFCTRYGSEIREHRRWDWVEHQIFSSHNLLAIWKISFSFSPSLSPFFFKHLYRNVWIYFLISLFQSPFFVCVCFERSHWKFGVQDNFATLVCSEVFALWLFGNQDHDQSPGETVKTSSKEPYPGFFHLFFKGFLPKLC